MKVGTDGVLLGAWAPFVSPRTILDVGTGSGLLSLMLAQRYPEASITGIDIDANAVEQAKDNVIQSRFKDNITIEHASLQDFYAAFNADEPSSCYNSRRFDAIICNPPFFETGIQSEDASRMVARHAMSLPFDVLITSVAHLLEDEGQFAVVLPADAFLRFHSLCFASGLNLEEKCLIQTSYGKPVKRIMGCFRKGNKKASVTTIQLMNDGLRTEAYKSLLKDFYLD